MKMLGSEFLEIVKNETFKNQDQIVDKFDQLSFKESFLKLNEMIDKREIGRIQIAAKQLIDAEPVLFSLELSIVNLPLRYGNSLQKIVDEENNYEVNVYMIVEHPLVSQSKMLIQKSSSVTAYQDDEQNVQTKIIEFFNEKLELIQNGGFKTLIVEKNNVDESSEK